MHQFVRLFIAWTLLYVTVAVFFIRGQSPPEQGQSRDPSNDVPVITSETSLPIRDAIKRYSPPEQGQPSDPSNDLPVITSETSLPIKDPIEEKQRAVKVKPTETSVAFDFAIVTSFGDIRVRLFNRTAPLASEYLRRTIDVVGISPSATSPQPPPSCVGCRFYRAEPVPEWWGSPELADSSFGGRWGPPYALLQGAFAPSGPKVLC
jgi:hypothetical protein